MNELEKAQKWFSSNGVGCYINDDQLYIYVEGLGKKYFHVLVSTSEVIYRVELYEIENNS